MVSDIPPRLDPFVRALSQRKSLTGCCARPGCEGLKVTGVDTVETNIVHLVSESNRKYLSMPPTLPLPERRNASQRQITAWPCAPSCSTPHFFVRTKW